MRTTTEFEEDLRALMQRWGLKTKTEAIRHAVRACARRPKPVDWTELVGILKAKPGAKRVTEDELWGDI